MMEQIVGGKVQDKGGVHIVPCRSIIGEDKSLLFAVSRIMLRADGPSLRAQLKVSVPSGPSVSRLSDIRPRRTAIVLLSGS